MVDSLGAVASLGDLARLLAVPLLGWAALRDIRTRRVPNWVWYVLGGLGAVLLAVDLAGLLPVESAVARLELLRIALSLGLVVPLAYGFWRLGGFGGADAKALMALAVLFPTYPSYYPPTTLFGVDIPPVLPVEPTLVGVFSLTVLTNTVLVGALFPVALTVRNALVGEFSPVMFLARVVPVGQLPDRHGRLFEDPSGFTRSGLDLDALRMYLRWRGCSLADLRANPERYRDPDSVGETFDATDGAVDPEARLPATRRSHPTAATTTPGPPSASSTKSRGRRTAPIPRRSGTGWRPSPGTTRCGSRPGSRSSSRCSSGWSSR